MKSSGGDLAPKKQKSLSQNKKNSPEICLIGRIGLTVTLTTITVIRTAIQTVTMNLKKTRSPCHFKKKSLLTS